jgi:hypothetical protein
MTAVTTSFATIELKWRFARDAELSREPTTTGEFAIRTLRINAVPSELY